MLLVSARKKKTPATSTRKGCQIFTCYQRNSVVPDAKIVHIRRSFPIRSMNIGGNSTFVATPVPSRVIPSSVITGIEFCASMGREAPSIGRQKLLRGEGRRSGLAGMHRGRWEAAADSCRTLIAQHAKPGRPAPNAGEPPGRI